MADTPDLGSGAERRRSSSLLSRTKEDPMIKTSIKYIALASVIILLVGIMAYDAWFSCCSHRFDQSVCIVCHQYVR